MYKKKDKILYSISIDDDQLSYHNKNQSKLSFALKSIKHIKYIDDLNDILFSTSKLTRFVFFVDLSSVDSCLKAKIFNVLLENIADKDDKQELMESIFY